MKHVIVLAIVAVTIPLFAAEKKATPPAPTPTVTITAAPAATQQQPDSPLVAAAKRSGRLGKKPTFVITNETLVYMNGGRMSVATGPKDIVVPPAPYQSAPAASQQKAQGGQTYGNPAPAYGSPAVQQPRPDQASTAARAAQAEDYLAEEPAPAAPGMMTKSAEQPMSKPSERPPQN
ncbi:MAG: hypothetical protein ACXVH7_08655 [Thermoanaerobaculia bacterium]